MTTGREGRPSILSTDDAWLATLLAFWRPTDKERRSSAEDCVIKNLTAAGWLSTWVVAQRLVLHRLPKLQVAMQRQREVVEKQRSRLDDQDTYKRLDIGPGLADTLYDGCSFQLSSICTDWHYRMADVDRAGTSRSVVGGEGC